jgi:hypothetical protein
MRPNHWAEARVVFLLSMEKANPYLEEADFERKYNDMLYPQALFRTSIVHAVHFPDYILSSPHFFSSRSRNWVVHFQILESAHYASGVGGHSRAG